MPAHVQSGPQSMGQRLVQPLTGLLLGLLLGGFGTFFAVAQTSPPVVDPVAAYCRGVSDGVAMVVLPVPPTEKEYEVFDADCYQAVVEDNVPPAIRGPLPGGG